MTMMMNNTENVNNEASVKQNLTPNDLTPEQNMLNLAGSKISFTDLYERETELAIIRGKYYRADEVNDLLNIINGMFTTISEQSWRTNTSLNEARKNNAQLEQSLTDISHENESLKSQINELQNEQGDNNSNDVLRLKATLINASQKLQQQRERIMQLENRLSD